MAGGVAWKPIASKISGGASATRSVAAGILTEAAPTVRATPRPRGPAPRRLPDESVQARSSLQRLLQIPNQILRILQPHRNPQQVLWRARIRPFHRRAMLDQAVCPTQAGGASEKPDIRGHLHRPFPPATQL